MPKQKDEERPEDAVQPEPPKVGEGVYDPVDEYKERPYEEALSDEMRESLKKS